MAERFVAASALGLGRIRHSLTCLLPDVRNSALTRQWFLAQGARR